MTEEPWFRLRPSKFMAGCRGLNPTEGFAYFTLVCRIMEHGEPIDEDREILAAYCQIRPSLFDKALDRLLRLHKLFRTDDGRLTNAFCDTEIAWRETNSKNSQRAGKISAEKRQEKQAAAATDVQRTFNHIDKIREEKKEGGGNAGAHARDDLHENVLAAAGVDPSKDVTGKWFSSGQVWAVQRWRDELGLSDEEIIATVRECANGHPPGTLAYFNPAMQRAAGRKSAPALRPVDNPGQPPPAFDLEAAMDRAAAANERRKAISE